MPSSLILSWPNAPEVLGKTLSKLVIIIMDIKCLIIDTIIFPVEAE
jgi:hypothetical protein